MIGKKKLRQWAAEEIYQHIRKGGELAHPDQADERRKICGDCKYSGTVEMELLPTVSLKDDGCKICGCPFSTKTALVTVMRAPEKQDENLTAGEIISNSFRSDLVPQTIKCPHPKGNKWDAVDSKFKNKKK